MTEAPRQPSKRLLLIVAIVTAAILAAFIVPFGMAVHRMEEADKAQQEKLAQFWGPLAEAGSSPEH